MTDLKTANTLKAINLWIKVKGQIGNSITVSRMLCELTRVSENFIVINGNNEIFIKKNRFLD